MMYCNRYMRFIMIYLWTDKSFMNLLPWVYLLINKYQYTWNNLILNATNNEVSFLFAENMAPMKSNSSEEDEILKDLVCCQMFIINCYH